MKKLTPEALERIAYKFGQDVPGLHQELQSKLTKMAASETDEAAVRLSRVPIELAEDRDLEVPVVEEVVNERIVAVSAGARPVARVRNNQVTTEFLGPDNESWAAAITASKDLIDRAIP